MVAYGVTSGDLNTAADKIGVRLEGLDVRGRGLKFTLRPIGETFRKVNPVSGRHINAICWHRHLAFFQALFDACLEAHVKTVSADYRGREEFLATFAASDRQEGSQGEPYLSSDCCSCDA